MLRARDQQLCCSLWLRAAWVPIVLQCLIIAMIAVGIFWPSKKSLKENVLLLIDVFYKLGEKIELCRPYKMDF